MACRRVAPAAAAATSGRAPESGRVVVLFLHSASPLCTLPSDSCSRGNTSLSRRWDRIRGSSYLPFGRLLLPQTDGGRGGSFAAAGICSAVRLSGERAEQTPPSSLSPSLPSSLWAVSCVCVGVTARSVYLFICLSACFCNAVLYLRIEFLLIDR